MKRRPEIRPARAEDARSYFGRDVPWPWFGIVAELDGVVVGIGGIAWREDGAFAFVDCARRWMPKPLTAHRLALRVLKAAFAAGESEIFTVPTARLASAKPWLAALGFRPSHHIGPYEVWKCQG